MANAIEHLRDIIRDCLGEHLGSVQYCRTLMDLHTHDIAYRVHLLTEELEDLQHYNRQYKCTCSDLVGAMMMANVSTKVLDIEQMCFNGIISSHDEFEAKVQLWLQKASEVTYPDICDDNTLAHNEETNPNDRLVDVCSDWELNVDAVSPIADNIEVTSDVIASDLIDDAVDMEDLQDAINRTAAAHQEFGDYVSEWVTMEQSSREIKVLVEENARSDICARDEFGDSTVVSSVISHVTCNANDVGDECVHDDCSDSAVVSCDVMRPTSDKGNTTSDKVTPTSDKVNPTNDKENLWRTNAHLYDKQALMQNCYNQGNNMVLSNIVLVLVYVVTWLIANAGSCVKATGSYFRSTGSYPYVTGSYLELVGSYPTLTGSDRKVTGSDVSHTGSDFNFMRNYVIIVGSGVRPPEQDL